MVDWASDLAYYIGSFVAISVGYWLLSRWWNGRKRRRAYRRYRRAPYRRGPPRRRRGGGHASRAPIKGLPNRPNQLFECPDCHDPDIETNKSNIAVCNRCGSRYDMGSGKKV